jgi:hypothetical protein
MATTLPAAVTAAQTGPRRAEVLDQVARLADLEESTVEQMRAEALGAPTRGVVAYGEYQSGGWWTTALMNHSDSGDPHDVVIGDGRPQPTSSLEEMPATARFLDSLGLNFMYVRLARLKPHSYLREHRDYAELGETDRHRLHIGRGVRPLVGRRHVGHPHRAVPLRALWPAGPARAGRGDRRGHPPGHRPPAVAAAAGGGGTAGRRRHPPGHPAQTGPGRTAGRPEPAGRPTRAGGVRRGQPHRHDRGPRRRSRRARSGVGLAPARRTPRRRLDTPQASDVDAFANSMDNGPCGCPDRTRPRLASAPRCGLAQQIPPAARSPRTRSWPG